jgi:hypothetical protein
MVDCFQGAHVTVGDDNAEGNNLSFATSSLDATNIVLDQEIDLMVD